MEGRKLGGIRLYKDSRGISSSTILTKNPIQAENLVFGPVDFTIPHLFNNLCTPGYDMGRSYPFALKSSSTDPYFKYSAIILLLNSSSFFSGVRFSSLI